MSVPDVRAGYLVTGRQASYINLWLFLLCFRPGCTWLHMSITQSVNCLWERLYWELLFLMFLIQCPIWIQSLRLWAAVFLFCFFFKKQQLDVTWINTSLFSYGADFDCWGDSCCMFAANCSNPMKLVLHVRNQCFVKCLSLYINIPLKFGKLKIIIILRKYGGVGDLHWLIREEPSNTYMLNEWIGLSGREVNQWREFEYPLKWRRSPASTTFPSSLLQGEPLIARVLVPPHERRAAAMDLLSWRMTSPPSFKYLLLLLPS